MPVVIVGAENFHALAAKLHRGVAQQRLVPDMRDGFIREAPGMREAVFRSIDVYLPDRYASVLRPTLDIDTTRTSALGDTATVTMTATAGGRHIGTTNAGNLRHPLFGHNGYWYDQGVRRGFVSEPMASRRDQLREAVRQALRTFLQDIMRG